MISTMSRREFIAAAAATTAGGLLGAGGSFAGKLVLFSKHLPDMDWRRLAQNVKGAGFDGVDLTVRKGGHVAPERAAEDLPKAAAAIRETGLDLPMITTALLAAAEPAAQPILSTAGRLGIPFFKPGYYKYDFVDVRRELEKAGKDFRALAELGKRHAVAVGYHNHAGYLGAPVWDMARVIDTLDPKWVGYYFDVCHATTEGGDAGWKIAASLAAPRIKMIAVKDFFWEKSARGWKTRMCPLGAGMVDWKGYFRILASAGFAGPVSLHLEYDIPGKGAALEDNTLRAAAADLEFLKARLGE